MTRFQVAVHYQIKFAFSRFVSDTLFLENIVEDRQWTFAQIPSADEAARALEKCRNRHNKTQRRTGFIAVDQVLSGRCTLSNFCFCDVLARAGDRQGAAFLLNDCPECLHGLYSCDDVIRKRDIVDFAGAVGKRGTDDSSVRQTL